MTISYFLTFLLLFVSFWSGLEHTYQYRLTQDWVSHSNGPWQSNRTVLVMLPGLDGCTSFLNPLALHAAPYYNVVIVHLPLSTSRESMSLRSIAMYVQEVIEPYDEVVLFGESFGGVVAQYLALLNPEKVSHLVLLSSLARTALSNAVWLKVTFVLPLLRTLGWLLPGTAQTLFAYVHSFDVVSSSEPAYLRSIFIREASWAHHFSVMSRVSLILDLDITAEVGTIQTPTLLIYGEEDHFTKNMSIELSGIINKSTILSIPSAGHLPHITAPDNIIGEVNRWVASSV